jgi:hypothetical protein
MSTLQKATLTAQLLCGCDNRTGMDRWREAAEMEFRRSVWGHPSQDHKTNEETAGRHNCTHTHTHTYTGCGAGRYSELITNTMTIVLIAININWYVVSPFVHDAFHMATTLWMHNSTIWEAAHNLLKCFLWNVHNFIFYCLFDCT